MHIARDVGGRRPDGRRHDRPGDDLVIDGLGRNTTAGTIHDPRLQREVGVAHLQLRGVQARDAAAIEGDRARHLRQLDDEYLAVGGLAERIGEAQLELEVRAQRLGGRRGDALTDRARALDRVQLARRIAGDVEDGRRQARVAGIVDRR